MKNNVTHRHMPIARTVTILAITTWFAAALVAGFTGILDEPGRPPLVLLGFVAVPMLGFLGAWRLSASFRALAESLDFTLIVGSHVWRFVGLGFVIGWLEGALPAGFAIPEGLGDIIAAAGALVLVQMLRRGTVSRGWLLAWNTFGLVDLVSAIALGILYSDSVLGTLSAGTPTTRLMVTFPVSLIPTFFVPLFILMHALTFTRIAAMTVTTNAAWVSGEDGRGQPESRVKGNPRLAPSPFKGTYDQNSRRTLTD